MVSLAVGLALFLAARSHADEPVTAAAPPASSLLPGAEEGYVDSGGVKIHYVSLGRKDDPLIVMIHGFPDFWYSWRAQMPELAKHFHVVAIDQRGYNLSGQPEGVENYTTDKLVGDVVAVVKHFGVGKAVIVGHDWGGLVAWTFAMTHPEMTDRLIVLNLPHPRGLLRELATNPAATEEQPVRPQTFRSPTRPNAFRSSFSPVGSKTPKRRKVYLAAFKRSSMEGMLNYYKANYPRIPDRCRRPTKLPCRRSPTFRRSSARCS